MFSWIKRRKSPPEVPSWAGFLNSTQYTAFTNAIEKYFISQNLKYAINRGEVELEDKTFHDGTIGLINLAQVCKQSDLSEYNDIIEGHFERLRQSKLFEENFNTIINDYEKARNYIGVRIYDEGYIQLIGKENTIGKDITNDLYAMLVFDFPDAVTNVQPAQAAVWGKTTQKLLENGIVNIREKYSLSISKENLGDFDIWFVESDHFYAANIVFELQLNSDLTGSYGALVGLPHRHAAIIYPIENLETLQAVTAIMHITNGMHTEGPGSLSNKVYWYKNEQFTDLPYFINDGKIEFTPPDDFIALMNILPAKSD
jgi:hypothetical protein